MTDYLPLLTRAVANLEHNPEGRRKVYDRARQALLAQLRAMNPPLAEAEITRERLALEEAIRRLDQQFDKQEAAAPPPPPVSPPSPPPPARSKAPAAPAGPPPRATPAPEPAAAQAEAVPAAASSLSARERVAGPPPSSKAPREPGVREPALGTSETGRSARGVFGATRDDGRSLESRVDATAQMYEFDDRGPGIEEPADERRRGRAAVDYAKVDAQRSLKAKLIVGGLVGALLGIAILIGFVHRDRILASIGLGPSPARVAAPAATGDDRIAPQPQAKSAPQVQAPAQSLPAAAVAQRVVLYEENPGATEEQLQTFVGTAVWRTETVSPGPGRPPELGLRVDIEVPDRKMTVGISMRRNPDETLPASHTVEVQFQTPNDPFGGVANLPGIRAKTSEQAQGAPLVGLVVRVMPGFFLIGLSAIEADREQNLSLLRERGWLDVPFVYNNGRRAVLVIEKGTPGERAVNEVVAAWGG